MRKKHGNELWLRIEPSLCRVKGHYPTHGATKFSDLRSRFENFECYSFDSDKYHDEKNKFIVLT